MLQQDQSVSAKYFLLILPALVMIGQSGCADQKAEHVEIQTSAQAVNEDSEQHDVPFYMSNNQGFGNGFNSQPLHLGALVHSYAFPDVVYQTDRWLDVSAQFEEEYVVVLDGYPVHVKFEYPGDQNWPHRLQNPRGKILGKHTIGSDDLLIVEVVVGRERLVQGLCIYELIDQTAVLRYVWDNKITDQVGDTSVIIKSNKINLTRRFPIIFQKATYSYYSVFDPHHHRLIPRLSYNSLPYFATLPWPPKYQEVLDDEEAAYTHCEPIIVR